MKDFFEQYFKIDIIEVIKQIVPIIFVLIVCLLAIKVIMKIIKRLIQNSKLEKSLHTFIETTVKVVLYFIVVLIIADMLSIPITSLLATFSVVGLAASLAIQDALANLASGVMILATHPFKCGDYVEGAGTAGTVKDINFTHTVLLTPDNKKIHVPNNQIVNAVIINYSEQKNRRVDLTFNLSYAADSIKIKEIMHNAINSHPKILKNEPIFVRTTAYKESGIDYTLRIWTKSEDYWDVYFDLLEEIKEELDKNKIEIPYNQLDVHITKV